MIAVTGGAGFIGSVVVSALNDAGCDDIVVVDRLRAGGKFKNLRAKAYRRIVDPEAFLEGITQGEWKPEAVVHLGARTDTSEPDADLMLEVNTRYTARLAQLALDAGARFLYASSASVYGDGGLGFADDDALTPRMLPLNPYAFSKWLTDVQALREDWTSRVAGLRFFNVFGPNEYHKGRMASVLWHSYGQIHDKHRIQLFQSHRAGCADGEQARDFVLLVKDVARVILWFLEHKNACGIFNLGSGKARTFNDLAAAIFSAVEAPPKVEYIPTPENIRHAYQYFTEADLTKLRAAGCDVPFTALETAVADYVQGYLRKDNPYL